MPSLYFSIIDCDYLLLLLPLAGTSPSETLKTATQVAVFEGQLLSWQLQLTNVSPYPISDYQLTVVGPKGQRLKPLPGALPASYMGPHLALPEEGLTPQLPISPQQTVTVPLKVWLLI